MIEVELPNQTIYVQHNGSDFPFYVDSLLGESNHQVFKIRNNFDTLAMKLFKEGDKLFQRESRFTFLSHPRILPPLISTSIKINNEYSKCEYNATLTSFCGNGTLLSALYDKHVRLSPVLVRSLFRQLVEAVEYLHAKNVAHLDIKLDNIYLDDTCNLKLGDYDNSYLEGDGGYAEGTPNYRAPEVCNSRYFDPYKADIYSMGIVLFTMASGDMFPFKEDQPKFYNMMKYRPDRFWNYIEEKTDNEILKDRAFRHLFERMVCENPAQRDSLKEIKESEWYLGETLDDEGVMNEFLKF